MAASKVGIAWGLCKFEPSSPRCKRIMPFLEHIKTQTVADWKCKMNASPWHCPPTQFELGANKYEGVDTFIVVRDPYSRMISEYYSSHHYSLTEHGDLVRKKNIRVGDLNDPKAMNQWIVNAAETAMNEGVCHYGHCTALHKFVYDDEGKQLITHVLKMEELSSEFPKLMKRYKLPVELKHLTVEHHELGIDDLSKEAIAKINEWAGPDFDYFGYEQLDPSKAEQ